jgi:very-short-patch-repair endonuclease
MVGTRGHDAMIREMDDCENAEQMGDSIKELSMRIAKYPEIVKKTIYPEIYAEMAQLIAQYEHCDSPIEFVLFRSIKEQLDLLNYQYARDFFPQTQKEILANGHKYRADIFIAEIFETNNKESVRVIVECDGHDFHEKTKEQAKHDKERDRNIQMEGYKTMHFTGSEIYNDPRKCAEDVFQMIESSISPKVGDS